MKIINYFRRRRIIAIIKDYIIMQMYFNIFEYKNFTEKYDKNCNIIAAYFSAEENSKSWNFEFIVDLVIGEYGIIFYTKEHKKYCITKKQVEKALYELIADRYLMRDTPNKESILFANKGLVHHINGNSFESDYKKDRRELLIVIIASISLILSTIGILFTAFKK
jgi:hypothetical protein